MFFSVVIMAGMLAFLDAFSIGANDVANSFALSVSAKTITYKQAVVLAVICEACGAYFLGASVADTIKGKIISVKLFEDHPELFMLAMACAMLGSSSWVMLATRMHLPVSTTHAIIGAVIGTGIAYGGTDAVNWGWKGLGQIIASWFISPVFASLVGALLFTIVRGLIMAHKNAYARAKIGVPCFFFLSGFILTFFLLYKGAPGSDYSKWSAGKVSGVAAGVGAACSLISGGIFVPYFVKYMEKNPPQEYKNRVLVPTNETSVQSNGARVSISGSEPGVEMATADAEKGDMKTSGSTENLIAKTDVAALQAEIKDLKMKLSKQTKRPRATTLEEDALAIKDAFLECVTAGVDHDIHDVDDHIAEMHDTAVKYDIYAEQLFRICEVLSSCTNSFAHGSNDLANALGPFAAVLYVYRTGDVTKKAEIPDWQVLFCIAALCLGIVLYGYRIMRSLGTEMTYVSPSRGFSMELGSTAAVLTASKLGLPISTTHCITGSTAGVGWSEGKVGDVNWRHLLKVFFGWVITVPFAAIVAGLFYSMLAYSPSNSCLQY